MPPSSPSTQPADLAQLLRNRPEIWSGRNVARAKARSTGHTPLDALLPGEGWPVGALTEIASTVEGIGEVSITVPALRNLCEENRRVVFIRPPHIPYAPALIRAGLPLRLVLWIDAPSDEDARWAAEQTLREGVAGAVLLWSDTATDRPLRRLQLAAEEGQALAFLFRPSSALLNSSPAALRLRLRPSRMPDDLDIEILKARGGRAGAVLLPGLRACGR